MKVEEVEVRKKPPGVKQPLLSKPRKRSNLSCRHIKPVAWLVIIGDGLHNFADGLALGAAISVSIPLGLGTMLAVLFHEIPHELGEYREKEREKEREGNEAVKIPSPKY